MKNGIRVVLILMVSVLFASCRYKPLDESKLPRPQTDFALSFVEAVRAQNIDYIRLRVIDDIRDEVTPELLVQMASMFPVQDVQHEVLGCRWNKFGMKSFIGKERDGFSTAYSFTIEYSGGDGRYAVAELVLDASSDELKASSFTVIPTVATQHDLNKFTLKDKPLSCYLFLIPGTCAVLFALFTFIVCCMTKGLKYKWAFLLTMFIGVFGFAINWTTGEMLSKVMLITIPQLYIHCAGWNSPWSVGFGVPVAAIVFWIYKGKLVESEKKNEEGIISAEKSEPAPKLSVSDITNENSPWGI